MREEQNALFGRKVSQFVHEEQQVFAQLSDSEQDNLIQVGQDDSKFSTEVG